MLTVFGLFAGLFYGLVLNMSFWPWAVGSDRSMLFQPGDTIAHNLARYLAFSLATSFGWDLMRGITTALLIAITGRPILATLRRAARKAAFDAPVEFEGPAGATVWRADVIRARSPNHRIRSGD